MLVFAIYVMLHEGLLKGVSFIALLNFEHLSQTINFKVQFLSSANFIILCCMFAVKNQWPILELHSLTTQYMPFWIFVMLFNFKQTDQIQINGRIHLTSESTQDFDFNVKIHW